MICSQIDKKEEIPDFYNKSIAFCQENDIAFIDIEELIKESYSNDLKSEFSAQYRMTSS